MHWIHPDHRHARIVDVRDLDVVDAFSLKPAIHAGAYKHLVAPAVDAFSQITTLVQCPITKFFVRGMCSTCGVRHFTMTAVAATAIVAANDNAARSSTPLRRHCNSPNRSTQVV